MIKRDFDNLLIEIILDTQGNFSADEIHKKMLIELKNNKPIKNIKEYIIEKLDFLYEMGFIGKTRLYYYSIP